MVSWLPLFRPAGALTAGADVAAGWAVAGSGDGPGDWLAGATLVLASVCLYAGGVALNDVCDAAEDARLRAERPIPSGAISRKHAALLAAAFLILGVALAFATGASQLAPEPVTTQQPIAWTTFAPGYVALALVAAIVLYNAVLKRCALVGPFSMGACRGLNLILGMSVGAGAVALWWPLALGHVAHIAGVTAMARHETDEPGAPHPSPLPMGEGAGWIARRLSEHRMAVGMAILLSCLTLVGWAVLAFLSSLINILWLMVFLALFGASVFPSMLAAWRSPSPPVVRRAVGQGVLGLIMLDAAIAAGFASPVYGLAVLCLWPMSCGLGRRFAIS